MARPAFINELTPVGSLSAGAALIVYQDGDTFRTTPQALITEAPSFTQSGSDALSTTVAEELARGVVYPEQFGAAETYSASANDTLAILKAIAAGVAQKKAVLIAREYEMGTQLALTSAHSGAKLIFLNGTLYKGFSGDLVTVATGCHDFCIDGTGVIDGRHGTYTGKGLVFSGSTDDPYFGQGIQFRSFTDTHIEFGADAGKRAKVCSNFLPGTGQTDARYIHVNGPDTVTMQRQLLDNSMSVGYVDLDGAIDTTISNPSFHRVEIDDDSELTRVINGNWANGGAMTISGLNTLIVGGRFSGNVTIDSDASGYFVFPIFTAGVLANNSANMVVIDRPIASVVTTTGVAASVGVTTNETVLATIDLPANLLGANDGLKLTTYWSSTSSANDKTFKIYFGADGAGTGGTLALSTLQTTVSALVAETFIHNRNNTSSQRTVTSIVTSSGGSVPTLSSAAIDCTAATEIVISGQKEVDSETLTLQGYTLTLLDS